MAIKKDRKADCHPERAHAAKGLCRLCYDAKKKRERYKNNPNRLLDYNKKWRLSNPEKAIGYRVEKYYGITYKQYLNLLKDQNHKCAICRESDPIHVDHCHETNSVRGILCGNCNRGLGCYKDSIELMENAILYIKRYHER